MPFTYSPPAPLNERHQTYVKLQAKWLPVCCCNKQIHEAGDEIQFESFSRKCFVCLTQIYG